MKALSDIQYIPIVGPYLYDDKKVTPLFPLMLACLPAALSLKLEGRARQLARVCSLTLAVTAVGTHLLRQKEPRSKPQRLSKCFPDLGNGASLTTLLSSLHPNQSNTLIQVYNQGIPTLTRGQNMEIQQEMRVLFALAQVPGKRELAIQQLASLPTNNATSFSSTLKLRAAESLEEVLCYIDPTLRTRKHISHKKTNVSTFISQSYQSGFPDLRGNQMANQEMVAQLHLVIDRILQEEPRQQITMLGEVLDAFSNCQAMQMATIQRLYQHCTGAFMDFTQQVILRWRIFCQELFDQSIEEIEGLSRTDTVWPHVRAYHLAASGESLNLQGFQAAASDPNKAGNASPQAVVECYWRRVNASTKEFCILIANEINELKEDESSDSPFTYYALNAFLMNGQSTFNRHSLYCGYNINALESDKKCGLRPPSQAQINCVKHFLSGSAALALAQHSGLFGGIQWSNLS